MKDSPFRLREKTAVIVGPVGPIVQAATLTLTEHGADVVLVDEEASKYQRFADNLIDQREINPENGRVAVVETTVNSQEAAREAFSRAAELFGSLEIFLDANFATTPILNLDQVNKEQIEKSRDEFTKTVWLLQAAINFLNERRRGRIVTLGNGLPALGIPEFALNGAVRGGLRQHISSLQAEVDSNQVVINHLILGLTEEVALAYRPQQKIQQTLEEIQKVWPKARILEPRNVAEIIAFLLSPLSHAIQGQTIELL